MKYEGLARRRFEDFKKSEEGQKLKEELKLSSFSAGYLQCIEDVISAIEGVNWEEVIDYNDLIIEMSKSLKSRYPEFQD